MLINSHKGLLLRYSSVILEALAYNTPSVKFFHGGTNKIWKAYGYI